MGGLLCTPYPLIFKRGVRHLSSALMHCWIWGRTHLPPPLLELVSSYCTRAVGEEERDAQDWTPLPSDTHAHTIKAGSACSAKRPDCKHSLQRRRLSSSPTQPPRQPLCSEQTGTPPKKNTRCTIKKRRGVQSRGPPDRPPPSCFALPPPPPLQRAPGSGLPRGFVQCKALQRRGGAPRPLTLRGLRSAAATADGKARPAPAAARRDGKGGGSAAASRPHLYI